MELEVLDHDKASKLKENNPSTCHGMPSYMLDEGTMPRCDEGKIIITRLNFYNSGRRMYGEI